MKKKVREPVKPTASGLDKFIREKNTKEVKLAIDNFRSKAHASENPLVRAVSLGNEIDTSTLYPRYVPSRSADMPNVVSDHGGEFMLSQGVLPHSVHRRSIQLPNPSHWKEAERRQVELQAELAAIENKLARKESDIRLRSSGGVQTSKLNSTAERGFSAPIIGSTFKFHTVDDRTTANNDYSWPEMDSERIKLKNTQYGLCTRVCDVPGGNLSIRPGVGRKPRPYPNYLEES